MAGPDSPIAYGDSIAFLLSQLGARSAERFRDRLSDLGIAPRQFAVLSHVCSGGPRNQQQLADLLGVHRNNMVALIDEMEKAAWVSRHRGEVDRRVFEIRATRLGADVVASVNQIIPELDAELTSTLNDTQIEQLTDALRAIAGDLGLTHATHPHVASRPHESTDARARAAIGRRQ